MKINKMEMRTYTLVVGRDVRILSTYKLVRGKAKETQIDRFSNSK